MNTVNYRVDGWECFPCGDEKNMLETLRFQLNAMTSPETVIVATTSGALTCRNCGTPTSGTV
jgi:hypothetical protein